MNQFAKVKEKYLDEVSGQVLCCLLFRLQKKLSQVLFAQRQHVEWHYLVPRVLKDLSKQFLINPQELGVVRNEHERTVNYHQQLCQSQMRRVVRGLCKVVDIDKGV